MLPRRLIVRAVWPVSRSCFQQEAPATAGGREQGAGEAALGECSVIPTPHQKVIGIVHQDGRHAGVLRASRKRLSPVVLIPIRSSSSRRMKGRRPGEGNQWKKPTWVPPSRYFSHLALAHVLMSTFDCDPHHMLPHLRDSKWFFPPAVLPPETRNRSSYFLIRICLTGILGGRFTHLSACREPQRHVQTEREGNNSQRVRSAPCCPSQSPARYGLPDLAALIFVLDSAVLLVFPTWLPAGRAVRCVSITTPPLLSCGLFSLSSSSFCAAHYVVVPCVPAQGVCKVHFCLSRCVRAHPSAKLLPCQQALPLRSRPQVWAHTHIRTGVAEGAHSTPSCLLLSHIVVSMVMNHVSIFITCYASIHFTLHPMIIRE